MKGARLDVPFADGPIEQLSQQGHHVFDADLA
jgi:hypothetical protein